MCTLYKAHTDPVQLAAHSAFLEAGKALESFLRTKLITMGGTELVKRTALATVYAGVALPLTICNTTSLALDSDFTRCKGSQCRLPSRVNEEKLTRQFADSERLQIKPKKQAFF